MLVLTGIDIVDHAIGVEMLVTILRAGDIGSGIEVAAIAFTDDHLFPAIFSKISKDDAPVAGMLIMLVLELLLATMTISPNLLKQFNILLNLAVFINMVPYVLSMTGLQVMLRKNHVTQKQYYAASAMGTAAVVYSIYGVYACGVEAVFGGTIITMIGYIFYGFLAGRDTEEHISHSH